MEILLPVKDFEKNKHSRSISQAVDSAVHLLIDSHLIEEQDMSTGKSTKEQASQDTASY